MQRHLPLSLSACGLLAAFTVACGGGIDSGVDKGKAASDVTDSEAVDICTAAYKYTQDQLGSLSDAQSCAYVGYQAGSVVYAVNGDDATIQFACKKAESACLDAASGNGGSTSNDDAITAACKDRKAPSSQCDVTVGEFESCWQSTTDQQVSTAKGVPSCDHLTREYLASQKKPERAASCDTVKANCPELATALGL
jgi:hypothetical protein